MLFIVIFVLSTRWHQENKLGLNTIAKEMLHTTGFTVTIILYLLQQAKIFTIF